MRIHLKSGGEGRLLIFNAPASPGPISCERGRGRVQVLQLCRGEQREPEPWPPPRPALLLPGGSIPTLQGPHLGPAMSPRGCLSVTKYFLFLFNLLFFVLGGIILSFGLWILIDQQSFAAVLGSSLYALKVWSYILSGVGIVTMLMGFLGCLGSLKEIKCMLGFYFGFLFLLFAAQITIGVLLYTQRVTLNGKVGVFVEDAIRTYPQAGPPSEKYQSWDFIQGQLQCCGWNSYLDWQQNPVVDNSSRKLYPCSCHNSSSPGERGTNITEAPAVQGATGFCGASGEWPVYRQGCANSVQGWLANNIISIVGVCLGIALMELCLMMLSMFLFRNMGQNYDKLTRYS
ncbi:leukocyte antigen CD37 isoform X3 [Mauremys mutica]|uniref:leukocyte antigen CD37 isoform X3 n=1 Tax=Mauremys mutica TaxID=74926 RepID=UPI001D16DCC2|nr:leukocyte antigen CD37 isoform X3 [Mauremys mutica]